MLIPDSLLSDCFEFLTNFIFQEELSASISSWHDLDPGQPKGYSVPAAGA